jgi:hypothetical protein
MYNNGCTLAVTTSHACLRCSTYNFPSTGDFQGRCDIPTIEGAISDITVLPCIDFCPHHPFDCRILAFLRRMASRRDCEGVTVCEQNLALQLAETNAYEYKQQDTSEYNVENDRLNAVSKPEPGLERHSRIDFYPHKRRLTAGMASGERQKRPEEVHCRRMASAASGCFARYRMVTLRAGVCRRWSSCCIRAPGTCWWRVCCRAVRGKRRSTGASLRSRRLPADRKYPRLVDNC